MNFRIVEVNNLAPCTIYSPQVRTWYGRWKKIKAWYQPEIAEMPGWMTEYFVTENDAMDAIKAYISNNPNKSINFFKK